MAHFFVHQSQGQGSVSSMSGKGPVTKGLLDSTRCGFPDHGVWLYLPGLFRRRTVDDRNPASPNMHNITIIPGVLVSKRMQDFDHQQQYTVEKNVTNSFQFGLPAKQPKAISQEIRLTCFKQPSMQKQKDLLSRVSQKVSKTA